MHEKKVIVRGKYNLLSLSLSLSGRRFPHTQTQRDTRRQSCESAFARGFRESARTKVDGVYRPTSTWKWKKKKKWACKLESYYLSLSPLYDSSRKVKRPLRDHAYVHNVCTRKQQQIAYRYNNNTWTRT